MLKWISNYIARQREFAARQRELECERLREWQVIIDKSGCWLCMPLGLFRQGKWNVWDEMQESVIARFRKHWPNSNVCIGFHADQVRHGRDRFTLFKILKASTTKDNEQIFTIPDCKDQFMYEDILSGCVHGIIEECIFVLDNKPEDWKETITQLGKIVVKLTQSHSPADFQSELSSYRLFCFSLDADIWIVKIDLPDSTVKSILEDVAREYDLELVIERK